MDATYRQAELENARKELSAARSEWQTATKPGKRREAAERVEFWGNKVSFLACAK